MPTSPTRPLPLPAVYGRDTVARAFAAAIGEAMSPAEERLDGLDAVLDPWRAPPAFLDWLIRITGARVEPGWSEVRRREAVDLAARLAAYRGTPYGLRLEAREILRWVPPDFALDVGDPGVVFTDTGQAPPPGRMLTVTLTAPAEEDQRALESRLTRLVKAHCPAHLPFRAVVIIAGSRREVAPG
ncbi:phage tail protein [Streptomyces sp. DSM 40473]|uniref:Phage tail protein n=1 Tax=Streptomyces hesseae TaxID=3075519 RepID=A0ABU2SKT9_9ACTN|nr:phage tail protein [Streptomyces sp. DSM 40473]